MTAGALGKIPVRPLAATFGWVIKPFPPACSYKEGPVRYLAKIFGPGHNGYMPSIVYCRAYWDKKNDVADNCE